MKTLLISSNDKNLSNIAIFLENPDNVFFTILKTFLEKPNSFRDYLFFEARDKEIFTEFGEKPYFTELIENNDIEVVFTYFETTNRLAFSLKQNARFIHYDFNDFLKENSFETLLNLLGGNNANHQSTDRENQGGNEDRKRGFQTGDRGTRTQNQSNANEYERRGVREQQGVSNLNGRVGETLSTSGEFGELQIRDKQRGGLSSEAIISAKTDTADLISSAREEQQSSDFASSKATTEFRDNNQFQSTRESKTQFRTRIDALLQSPRMFEIYREILHKLVKFKNRTIRRGESSNPRNSSSITDTRIEQRGEYGGLNRGIKEFELKQSYSIGELTTGYGKNDRSGIKESEIHTEFNNLNSKSPNNQQSPHTNTDRFSTELRVSQGKLDINSNQREQKEQDNQFIQSQESNGNISTKSNEILSSMRETTQNTNFNGGNGILQTQRNQENPSNVEHRKTLNTELDRKSNDLEQDNSSQNKYPRENQQTFRGELESSLQRRIEQMEQDDNTEEQTLQTSLRASTTFGTLSEYELVKKLNGKEYKGEIDFKLSKKQRIEANLEAIKLVREIGDRRIEIQRSQIDSETGEIKEHTKNNSLKEYLDFLEKARIKTEQEFKEKNYFSFECPYNEQEQIVLAKYSGFGGLKDLFYDKAFEEQREELLRLVGRAYYEEMKFSSFNAYYTPSSVIEAMFEGLKNLGVPDNEKVVALEPSCGIGHFITKAPPNYEFIAIEKDSLSATIAKLLHPKTIIYNKSYEEAFFKREFDVIIGNPPYENEKAENSKELIHNFFVLKSQNLLKVGGLSSFVITSGFMDSKTNFHREKLMQENSLLSAFRLPNSTFKSSHTEVLTDIVFFRKFRDKKNFLKNNSNYSTYLYNQINKNDSNFLQSIEREINTEKSFKINSYFSNQTEHILGIEKIGNNQFLEPVLKVEEYKNASLKELIKNRLKNEFNEFSFYDLTPAYAEKSLNLTELDIPLKFYSYVLKLRIGNLFEYNDKFYTKEEDLEIKEVFFEDELENSKKYLLNNKRILKQKDKNLIYQNPINESEKEILRKIIAFRDLLNENLSLERKYPNNEAKNLLILNQKEKLRQLRMEILELSNTKAFNVSNQKSKKDENGIITRHSLKRLIELEKIESFKIFATENVIKIPKKNKFEYKYEEADILKKRVLYPLEKTLAKDATEALQKTINEVGYIDINVLLSYLPDKSSEEILLELSQKELIFPSFSQYGIGNEKTQYCLKSEFLSGNIKTKAHLLERMIKDGVNFNAYAPLGNERYLEILKENFPKHIPYEDLEINFGANFIDVKIYKDFIKQSFFKNPLEINVQINILNGEYILEEFTKNENGKIILTSQSDLNDLAKDLEVKNEKANTFFDLRNIIERTMNNKSLEVYHYEEIEKDKKVKVLEQAPTSQALKNSNYIKDLFAEFVFKNKDYRESIEKQYNEQINVFSNTKFEFKDMLETPYLNKDIVLRTHQKNAVFKGILENSLLLDHQVGAGKTLVGIALVMEQIRMKLIKKALVLVPNHLSLSWGNEFIRAYPNAKILIGDKIDSKKARKEFLYRARNGDYEAIIMKHSTFENMNVMESFEAEVLQNEIDNLRMQLEREKHIDKVASEKDRKKLEEIIDKKIKRFEKKLESLAKGKTYDDEIAFEDLGVDCLVVDEAHYFKNLFISTSQQNVKGIPTQESRKAMKMYCATQYCHTNNFKLYFLTGTPISNSIAEFYTMQRYIQPQILRELKLENFDEWQKAFTTITLNEELDSSGINYTLVSRLSNFINAPELMNIYKQNADVVTTEEIEKLNGKLVPKVKEGKAINIIAPRSESIACFIGIEDEFGNYNEGSIIDRMNNFADDPQRNNILVCTSEARKAALDFRLIDPYANDYEESKINQMVKKIKEHYNDERYEKNTQLVFCDLGVSKKNSQKIDVNIEQSVEIESIEDIAKRKGLEFHIEYDEDGNEIKSYYREFQKDNNGKFLYEEYEENGVRYRKKIVEKIYEIEELLNEQAKFDVYADILRKLVKNGIPQNEIAFIGDAKNDKDKQKLFDKINAGIVRVLIGSTSKMGTGTNVQERIVAMHELDCPWKPSELEQRAGRGIRQGNIFFAMDKENFEIAHYRYATEQTYDARMFQINEQKLKPLIQMKKADNLESTRVFKSIDEEMANIAEMKAIATGNPFILEKHRIKNLLDSELNYKKYYEKSIINNEKSLKIELHKKETLQDDLEALKIMLNNKAFSKENYELEILGIKTTKKPKDKTDEKNHNSIREKIEIKLYQMLRQTEDFTSETENGKRKIDFLKANNIKIELYTTITSSNLYFQGVIITQNNKTFAPSNLNYSFERNNLFKTEFNLNSFLTKVKNNFDKSSIFIEEKSKELKECEDSIKTRQKFLENNTLDNYERKFLIDVLKQDELNINEIFKIRQEKKKEGIKIDEKSKEIKHLLPKYHKFLNERGKLQIQNDNQQEKQNEVLITSEKLESENLIYQDNQSDNPVNAVQENKENDTKSIEKDETLEIKEDKTAKKELIESSNNIKIDIKSFDENTTNIDDKMKILEQNMANIQKNSHSKRLLGFSKSFKN